MKDFLDKNIIHTKAIQVKNMLERFRKLDITLREVDDLSARMVYKLKFDKEKVKKHIGSDLMLRKYIDAKKSVALSKKQLGQSRKILNTVLRKGTLVRDEYMKLLAHEIQFIWNQERSKNYNKINMTKAKKANEIVDEIDGIAISNKALEEIVVENDDKANTADDIVVYDNVEVNPEEAKILSLPPNISKREYITPVVFINKDFIHVWPPGHLYKQALFRATQ